MLSTCNRAEIYAVAESDDAAGRARPLLQRIPRARRRRDWPSTSTSCSGGDAARHLFRVAAGLDSLVVGEPQILGQVKAAYAAASDLQFTGAAHSTGCSTRRSRVGKRVRSETGLGEGAVSVSYAAIALAKKIFGDLTGLNVLILGAGEMAKLTGVHLQGAAGPADHDRQPHARDGRSAGARSSTAGPCRGRDLDRRARRRRHRRHRDRRDRAGADARAASRRRCGRGAAGRCSSSTSRCRATSSRRSAISTRCSSTTSTTCRTIVKENLARRAARARARRSDRRRGSRRGSRRGCSRARSSRRSSRCAQRFEAIRQAELARLEPKLAGAAARGARARRRDHAA